MSSISILEVDLDTVENSQDSQLLDVHQNRVATYGYGSTAYVE